MSAWLPSSGVFQRDSIRAFRFVDCGFDPQTGVASLRYAFDDGPVLTETVTIPGAPFALDDARKRAVDAATRLLHLIAGVSYYKAAVPEEIRIENGPIDASTAEYLESLYLNGLGEFAYRNGLNLHGRIRFPHADAPSQPAPALGLREHALVAIGGGKDSLVSIEALRAAGIAQTVTWVGGSQLIAQCAARTGLPTLNIGRQIAPELFELNRQGAWNGHIPVTAINSAIMVLAALLVDADQVVFSNERSASYGSLIEGTGEVNHQWSKGWAAEQGLAKVVRETVAADLKYYSLLRPLSELAVARQFAKNDHYDAWFSSCNRNFHLLGEKPTQRWCGVCPKCHFVFLALAPFVPKPRLVGIFGRNLLDDRDQIGGYDALLEYRDHKPFECVGEGGESRAAMAALSDRSEWREDEIADARSDPPALSQALHTERLVALPDSQWCYPGNPAHAFDPVPPFERNGHITFGSFSAALKITPGTCRRWARVLLRLPGSRLVIGDITAERKRAALREIFAGEGVAAERVEFRPRVGTGEYMALYNGVDMTFDPFPYGGGTTTFDSLWMGVPVAATLGQTPVSRSAASILAALGLEEWIAGSPDDFVEMAVARASDRAALRMLRASLRSRMQASALTDMPRFVGALESAYRRMWIEKTT